MLKNNIRDLDWVPFHFQICLDSFCLAAYHKMSLLTGVGDHIVIRGRAVLDSALLNAPLLDSVTADLSNKDVATFSFQSF